MSTRKSYNVQLYVFGAEVSHLLILEYIFYQLFTGQDVENIQDWYVDIIIFLTCSRITDYQK